MSGARVAAVIGAGPAGLMATEVLSQAGIQVDLYDAKPSAGRKFLVAGKGGLNLTHSEPFEKFVTRYGDRQKWIEPLLRQFGPLEIRQWAEELGIETFVGSSGRVFPVGMRSTPLLRAWLERLRATGVRFHFRHKWIGWTDSGSLRMESPAGEFSLSIKPVILALGGASWSITGSTGEWVPFLAQKNIPVAPLKPSNCGFNVGWSDHFRERFAGVPLKTVMASFTNSSGRSFRQQGEFVITETGVEGSLIYACSALLREEIEQNGIAVLHLDLAPGYTSGQLVERFAKQPASRSTASRLEKAAGIKSVKAGLLWELTSREDLGTPERISMSVKDLTLQLSSPRPIDEAISSAGGVQFEAMDSNQMVKALPGVFCAGEMLDWEAPTGGYLLTACLATGRSAALGALTWMGMTAAVRK